METPWHRWVLVIAIILTSLVGLIAVLPPVAATAWGARAVEKWVEEQYGDEIQVRLKSMELSWGGPQTILGLELLTADRAPLIVVEKATTNTSLVSIFWHVLSQRELHFTHPIHAQIGFATAQDSDAFGPLQYVVSSVEGGAGQLLLDAPISIPLGDPARWETLQLSGILEIPPLEVTLNKDLAQLLALNEKVSMLTSPLLVATHQGRVDIERVDLLLANRYQFALWGFIDLSAKQMQLIAGLDSAATAQLFNVTTIPRGQFLQIPISAQAGELFVDRQHATRQAMYHELQSRRLNFLKPFVHAQEAPPPPPPPYPLPWEQEPTGATGATGS